MDLDDEADDSPMKHDISQVVELFSLLATRKGMTQDSYFDFGGPEHRHGADTMVIVNSGQGFPVHSVILAARSTVLRSVLTGQKFKDGTLSISLSSRQPSDKRRHVAHFTGIHPLTVLIFLRYLYTDELLAVWDRRIGLPLQDRFSKYKLSPNDVRSELQRLSKAMNFTPLSVALESHAKRSPTPSLARDMQTLLEITQNSARLDSPAAHFDPIAPNVILELSDKEVYCHSTILRARSPFFAGFFDDRDWTVKRWTPDRTIRVNLKHMKSCAFSFVIRYMYCGGERDMFDGLGERCLFFKIIAARLNACLV